MKSFLFLILLANTLPGCAGYAVMPPAQPAQASLSNSATPHADTTTRRLVLTKLLGFAAGAALLVTPQVSQADVDVSTIEMKEFVDPYGLFSINVPAGFFTLRRKAKGDLPDEKTGKGRRGSSIFTAGNMAKAEVIAVER